MCILKETNADGKYNEVASFKDLLTDAINEMEKENSTSEEANA